MAHAMLWPQAPLLHPSYKRDMLLAGNGTIAARLDFLPASTRHSGPPGPVSMAELRRLRNGGAPVELPVQRLPQQPPYQQAQEQEDWQPDHSGSGRRAQGFVRPNSQSAVGSKSKPWGPRLARADKRGDAAAAVASGLGMLMRRPLTCSEVQGRLTEKGYEPAAVEQALARLTELVGTAACWPWMGTMPHA